MRQPWKNPRPLGRTLTGLAAALLLAAGCGGDPATPAAPTAGAMLEAGFARVDISPEEPVKMGGYGMAFLSESFLRWSEGVHDPLYATAVALVDDDGPPIILVTLDVLGTILTDVVRIQEEVASRVPVPPERVVVCASHSHGSPDTVGIWGVVFPPSTGRMDVFIERMIAGAVDAAVDAYGNRRPAVVRAAAGQESRFHYNVSAAHDPGARLDSTMTVIGFSEPGGRPIGTVVNWGCHPTVMGPQNLLVTADYVGAFRRRMDRERGGVNLFVNGNIGGAVRPRNELHPFPDTPPAWGTWEDVERLGGGLAETALGLLEGAAVLPAADLDLRTGEVEMVMDNPLYAAFGLLHLIPREIPPLGGSAAVSLTAWRLGPVVFATVPGELDPAVGLELRERMGGDYQVVANIGQDWVGYMMTEEQYANPDYIEFWLLCPGPDAGSHLLEAYAGLLPLLVHPDAGA